MGVDWTKVDEIRLLRWVAEFKPAGFHKHFHMFCIVERMNHPDKYPVVLLQKESVKPGKVFTATEIWDKLDQYYNFEIMDELEDQDRFKQSKEFELPWDEYGDLILDHAKGDEEESTEEPEVGEKEEEKPIPIVQEVADANQSEREDQSNPTASSIKFKRRSTRLRKSSRLNQSRSGSDDDEASNIVSGGSEPDGEDEEQQNIDPIKKTSDQPLAKRTRHTFSATTNTMSNDISPKKKKRRPGEATPPPTQQQQQDQQQQQQQQQQTQTLPQPLPQPEPAQQQATSTPAQAPSAVRTSSRVSSRLRNKK